MPRYLYRGWNSSRMRTDGRIRRRSPGRSTAQKFRKRDGTKTSLARSFVGVRMFDRAPRDARHDRDAQGRDDCSCAGCAIVLCISPSELRQEVARAYYDNYHPLAGAEGRSYSRPIHARRLVERHNPYILLTPLEKVYDKCTFVNTYFRES